jgi:nucleoside-diphosphate-sugar epimerase
VRRILLTGGGGFIGSHLCQRLADSHKITIYDNGSRDALRYTELQRHPNLTYVDGDILDQERLRKAAEGAQVIIHLAAIAGVSNYYDRPVDTMRTNVQGTLNVLQAACETRPELFVNFSSSEVYGPETSGAHESSDTTQGEVKVSRWTYSVSKLAGEHLCFAYHRQHGLPVVSIRPFNIYGPRQVGEGAVQIFAALALRNEPITVHNDGSQLRAWCYIDDFVDGLLRCLGTREAIGEVFNIGNPVDTVSVRALAQRIIRLAGSRSEIVFAPFRPTGSSKGDPGSDGEVRVRVPSIEKAEKILGFRPRVGLDEGLERTIAWYRDVYLRR